MNPPYALQSLRSSFISLLLLTAPAVMAQSMPVMELRAGFHRIEAEVAANQPARMQGLMQRRSLGPNQGMLFVFPFRDRHCMWMRNTLIPLDMIFIDARGEVRHVHANARPLDETAIPGAIAGDASPERLMVLEVPGGDAARLGIVPGMVLSHPRLPQATALAPCD